MRAVLFEIVMWAWDGNSADPLPLFIDLGMDQF